MQYEVHVTRESGWWMIAIPALDGVTQARRRHDVEREARDFIVVTEDVAPSQVDVSVTRLLIDGTDYADQLRSEREARSRAEESAREARAQQLQIATRLHEAGLSMREIGTMLDISHQRVQQLLASSAARSPAA